MRIDQRKDRDEKTARTSAAPVTEPSEVSPTAPKFPVVREPVVYEPPREAEETQLTGYRTVLSCRTKRKSD